MAKSDRDHAIHLLAMAGKDYAALSKMQDRVDFAEEIFGFHAQQAIEKSLKAWVAAVGLAYPKSHDISKLVRILRDFGADLGPFPDLESYSVYAVQYRYEAIGDGDQGLNRTAIIRIVAELILHVRQVVDES